MTNRGLSDGLSAGLLGVELGRNKVRLSLVDPKGSEVLDVVERPIAKAGGPRDPIEQEVSTRAAVVAALDRLGLPDGSGLLAGATIGFSNCGVGSGPALQGWLESLSEELSQPLVQVGDVGISYAPARCLDFVQRVFDQSGLRLDRVELAPVAAARTMGRVSSAAVSLGSGIAWTARILEDQVLEAFEAADGPFDDALRQIGAGGELAARPIALHGIAIEESLCRNRGVTAPALAPAIGVARGLLSREHTNLLDGRAISSAASAATTPPPSRTKQRAVTGELAQSHHDAPPADRQAAYVEAEDDSPAWARQGSIPTSKNTYQLRRVPEDVHPVDHGRGPDPVPGRAPAPDEFAGIEAFAHAEEPPRGVTVFDVVLGILAVLAVVLLIALFLL
ncbi:MAG: hypothetical protein AAF962_21280 [Actinomycetota bacterium]